MLGDNFFIGIEHKICNLKDLNSDPVIVRNLFLRQVSVSFYVQVSRIQAEFDSLGNGSHHFLVVDND